MTSIYYTFCKQLPAIEYKKAVSQLPDRMQAKIAKYRRWQDAQAYLYGRLLLKYGMHSLGFNYSLVDMKTDENGKPYFPDSSFSFNISHSGEYIVCIISIDEKSHLGIDIEEVRPLELKGFEAVFSPEEKEELNDVIKFYTYWTRKEAVIKADGRGMKIPLDLVNTTALTVPLDGENYHLHEVKIDEDYVMHFASLEQIDHVDIVDCSGIALNV